MPKKNNFNLQSCCRKLICRFFVVSVFFCANAQALYTPCTDDTVALSHAVNVITNNFKAETDSLQGNYKKYIADIYTERFTGLKQMFDTREVLTLPEAQAYLQSLANEIIKANPLLQPLLIKVYFSKTAVPNAATWGEGVIIFNIGLFAKLDNESQAAFVLCHELAHLYLKHSNNSISKYVATLYSDETQRELKEIKNSQFYKRVQLESLAKVLTFNSRRHSRDHETEADSLGVVFMHNTNFETDEALTCLALLDSVDNDNFDAPKFMRETFNCKEYPFKEKWLEKEDGLLGGHAVLEEDTKLEDSLKTHPDCKARIAALSKAVKQYENSNRKKYLISKVEFEHLKQIFPYEMVSYYYNARNYSLCLFFAFKILEKDSANAFAITITGNAFNAIYDSEKGHILSKVIDMPGPSYPANYNMFLQFIQNLYLEEIASVNYYYLKQRRQQLAAYPAFEPVFIACAKHMSK